MTDFYCWAFWYYSDQIIDCRASQRLPTLGWPAKSAGILAKILANLQTAIDRFLIDRSLFSQ